MQELAVLSIGVWQEAVGGSGDHLVGASAAAPPRSQLPAEPLSLSGGILHGKRRDCFSTSFTHQSCRMAMLGAPAHKGMHRRSPAAPEAPSAAAACLCPASRNCSHRFAADSAAERIRVDLAWRDAAHPQAKPRLLRLFCRRSEQATHSSLFPPGLNRTLKKNQDQWTARHRKNCLFFPSPRSLFWVTNSFRCAHTSDFRGPRGERTGSRSAVCIGTVLPVCCVSVAAADCAPKAPLGRNRPACCMCSMATPSYQLASLSRDTRARPPDDPPSGRSQNVPGHPQPPRDARAGSPGAG